MPRYEIHINVLITNIVWTKRFCWHIASNKISYNIRFAFCIATELQIQKCKPNNRLYTVRHPCTRMPTVPSLLCCWKWVAWVLEFPATLDWGAPAPICSLWCVDVCNTTTSSHITSALMGLFPSSFPIQIWHPAHGCKRGILAPHLPH